ncbi:tellurium resistance protein [Maritimibacter sp. 55A14]|uniref:SLAC1 family transporter n=1 Tax=Maritimibacter sp. 55A14 TaxID=2174844 RepID=UPI001E3E93DB|nr:tellurium resistance protein [Maritimibacter sp. 55A14]
MQAGTGLWRRTPPAIFPPVLGLLGLGLAWRRASEVFGIGAAPGEMLLGAATLLFLFTMAAYVTKLMRRPGVFADELRILPGRAGLAAMTLSVFLFALVLEPYSLGAARAVLAAGFAAHTVLALVIVRVFVTGPPEQRRVTPVWHLNFVGFIVGALAAAPLGYPALAEAILWVTLPLAALIGAESLRQFLHAGVPAPLRPLLAIHLSPVCLLGAVALMVGQGALGAALAWAGLGLAVLFLAGARWLTQAGFSPFWGAFTFPLAAFAGHMELMAGLAGGPWRILAGLALVGATLAILPIAWKVMQLWAKGRLAVQTNAAEA